MFGSDIVEVAIGLAFTFFLISSICNGIVEIIAELTKARAKNLLKGLKYMLNDPDGKQFLKQMYAHSSIDTGMTGEAGHPTYIAAENFAEALLDTLVPNPGEMTLQQRVDALKDKIQTDVTDPRVQQALLRAITKGEDSIENVIKNVADWFNNCMWDLSKIYRKWTKKIVIITSVVIVLILNVDSVKIVKTLYTNDDIRQATVAATEKFVENYSPTPTNSSDTLNTDVLKAQIAAVKKNVDEVQLLPVGWWNEKPMIKDFEWVSLKFLGLLLTIGAVSLGSGFWYDFITKFLSFKKGS